MADSRESRQQELARLLLQKARQDLELVQSTVDSSQIADEIVGFHAQQAVEKSLKAGLVRLGIEYRFTHDLSVLYQQARDAGVEPPDLLDAVDELTDFAVQFRYSLLQDQPLNRSSSLAVAIEFIEWAQAVVDFPLAETGKEDGT